MKSKLALLNSTVLTSNGIFKLTDLSLQEARNLVLQNLDNLENCIGHQATALTLSNLLNIEVLPERSSLSQVKGQLAIVLKLNGRVNEGQILSQSEMEQMGYSLKLLEKLDRLSSQKDLDQNLSPLFFYMRKGVILWKSFLKF